MRQIKQKNPWKLEIDENGNFESNNLKLKLKDLLISAEAEVSGKHKQLKYHL